MSYRLLIALTMSAVVLLAGCKKPAESASVATTGQPAQTSVQPGESAAAAAPAPGAPAAAPSSARPVIASGEYAADPNLRCDLLEVKRVSGGALLVRWRVVNTNGSQQGGSLTATEVKPIYYNFGWEDIYYVDPAENKKYSYLTDSEGNRIIDVWYGSLPTGEQRANWAKFPAPPPTSTMISLNLPKFPPFEDVPIAQ